MTRRFDPGELAPPADSWGTTLLLSLGLHLFGFGLAVGLPRLVPRPAMLPVYVVDLVTLPGGTANVSPAPAAPTTAAKPNPPPAPKEEKAITIPERNKKPEPKSTPAKPKPAETPAAAKPEAKAEGTPQAQGTPSHGASMSGVSGGTGAAGGGFGGSGAAQADVLSWYASVIDRNVKGAWRKPLYPPGESRAALTATFRITLASSGRVSNLVLVTSSGYDSVDHSLQTAIQDAIFPPLPSALGSSFTFQLEFTFTRD